MASNFAWGIDVGNRALKAVKLVREGDQLRVDDFDVIEHETVLSNAGDNKEELIKSALSNFATRHPSKGGQYAIGVSGQASFARFIKLPPVEPKKIPEIVRFEAIQQIPFPLDDVEWSYQLFQGADSPDVEVGIFAMRKELVNQHINYFTDIDMNVQVVQMSPLAVYNAMYHDNRLQGTTMVIDLGAENTDLIICDNETIWLRSIPIGGNNFTDALVKAFKLNFAKAEDLKRNAATSKYARQIFQAMRPIFADLVAEIQRSVGFYASVHRDSRIKKVLALGGTFKLPGLQKYLQQNLQLDVERLDTISAAPSAESKLAPTFNENVLSVVTAYGLAIQAMGDSKITSSLLPAKIRREKMWKQKTPLFGAAAALFAAGLGVGLATWWLNDMSFHSARASDAYSHVNNVLTEAQGLDNDWSQVEGATAGARQKIINVQSLLDYRFLWPKLVADIQSALPQSSKPQMASLDPAEMKKLPRKQRPIVLINNIVSDYRPDISQLLTANDITIYASSGNGATVNIPTAPGAEGGQPAEPTAATPRGFILTIHCTTPFATGPADLIQKQFIPALLNIKPGGADKEKKFAIVKAQIVQPLLVKEDQTRLQQLRDTYSKALAAATAQTNVQINLGGGGGGYGGGPADMEGGPRQFPMGGPGFAPPVPMGGGPNAGGGGPNPTEDMSPFMDRATGESMLDDWEVTIVALVQIDPPPPAPPAAPAGQPAQ
jgi:type IV pilus assembly protein PilM